MTRPPARVGGVHPFGGLAGTRNRSGYGRSPPPATTRRCAARAGHAHAAATSRGDDLGREGAARAGISALPGSVAYTFWYASMGQSPVDVPVPDRPAVPRAGSIERPARRAAAPPTHSRVEPVKRREQLDAARPGRRPGPGDARRANGRVRRPRGRRSSTSQKPVGRAGRREVQHERPAARRVARRRRPGGCRTCSPPEVAGGEELGDPVEAGVPDARRRPAGHEHADGVTARPAPRAEPWPRGRAAARSREGRRAASRMTPAPARTAW